MKIFTKIALWLAGILAGIGIICMIIAWMMGIRPTDVKKMTETGIFDIAYEAGAGWNIFGTIITEDKTVITETANVEVITLGEEQTMEIPFSCQKIEIEYGAGTLNIFYDDVSDIQIIQKNVLDFSVQSEEEEQWLYIEGNKYVKDAASDVELTVILPKNSKLKEFDLEFGAGVANLSDLQADEVSIEVGAGVINLSGIEAGTMALEVGTGELVAKNTSVQTLDVETGLGEADIEISGAETDYNYDIACGMGDVTVGEVSYAGMGTEQNVTNSSAGRYMDIACGMGAVNVHFTCDTENGTCVNPSHNHSSYHHSENRGNHHN